MGVFSFLKKNESAPAVGPLAPPKPPVRPQGIEKLDSKLPPLGPGKTIGGLPPLPPMPNKRVSDLPPLPPLSRGQTPSLPPLPTPGQPAQKPGAQTQLERAFSEPLPSPKAVGVPNTPVFKSSSLPLPSDKPAAVVTAGAPSLPPLPTPAQKPSMPKLPELPTPAQKPLPGLGELPKISVPKLPAVPTTAKLRPKEEPKPEERKGPEPLQPGGKLQKLLDELGSDDFELPTIERFEEPAPVPHFEPMLTRATMPHAGGPLFVSLQPYEQALAQLKTVEVHLHSIQSHNEKLGHIENSTKSSLDSLSELFEHMQRHLLSVDEKLFKVN